MNEYKPSLRNLFLVAVGSLLFLILLWQLTPVQVIGYDGGFYRAMTLNPLSGQGKTTTSPYAFRLLPAWLLHFIPGRPLIIYTIYNAFISILTVVIIFKLLARLGFGPLEGGIAVFIYLSSWVNIRFSLYNPIHIDSTYYLILSLAFYSLISKNKPLFFGCLLAGAATREYFVTLIPLYYFFNLRPRHRFDPRLLGETALISAIPLAAFVFIRLLIPAG